MLLKMRVCLIPILHIATFQAFIEGYSRSKSYMNFSFNE